VRRCQQTSLQMERKAIQVHAASAMPISTKNLVKMIPVWCANISQMLLFCGWPEVYASKDIFMHERQNIKSQVSDYLVPA
jgi:hypothetical protein